MKERCPNTRVDWKDPENAADQHTKRYEYQLLNSAALDVTRRATFERKTLIKTSNGFGGVVETTRTEEIELTPDEKLSLRNHAVDAFRRGFLATGGDNNVAKEIIEIGNDFLGNPPSEAIIPVHFKKKVT